LTGKVDKNFECYFNRGLAMSQFAARYLNKLAEETGEKDRDKLLRVFKAEIGKHDAPIRNFLGGELRLRMLDLLTEAKTKKQHIYGALYELEDEELISKLQDLGARAHIVLSNGSVDKAGGDQNAEGRKLLKKAKVEVHDRMVCTGSGGPLGHNKFLVIADDKGNPESVWTGSTNWTKTGLCTQINNGIYIHDTATAGIYFRQYKLLRDAGDVFPKALVDSNDAPSDVTISGKSEKIWFTRVRKKSDTEAIDEVIAQAKDAILFLMFMPGPTASLRAIRQRIKDSPDLYVQGVATQVPADGAKEAEVTTIGSSGNHRVDLKILQVEGIKYPFASWLAEVTRKEFIANIGHAIVHSKVILVDPLTNPVLIVGSHNFSNSASAKNDENFVIIKNHKGLAEAYAAHILSIYSHFRWRTTVADKQSRGEEPWGGLSESDDWQGSHLQGRSLKEMKFWVP
jgi:phosphatidylserine/phosphatidylglycerophosphate/cardiolipin synthase-like enzyme